jgi:hypothetical protein
MRGDLFLARIMCLTKGGVGAAGLVVGMNSPSRDSLGLEGGEERKENEI